MVPFSIVIVSYHTGAILKHCLSAALKQQGLKELIIVDNGNPPAMEAWLDGLCAREPRLAVVRGHGNIGFAKACNLGAAKATGNYILLLNPDGLLPDENAVQPVITAMEAHPDAWLAGVQMVDADGRPQGGSKRLLLSPWVALSQVLHLYRLSPRFPSMNLPEPPKETTPSYVQAVSGAFMLLPKARYQELGGLDEGYFFHVEDLDLCKNIADHGGKALYVPAVKLLHYRSSSKVSSLFIERHKTAGFIRYFRKHLSSASFLLFFWPIALGIYMRLGLRMLRSFCCAPIERKKERHAALHRARQLALLSGPVEKQPADLSAFSPAMLAGSTGQVGLNILHHLLGNGIRTYALYHQQLVDYDHPQLHWAQGSLALRDAGIAEAAPKTYIHTPALWLLPPQIARAAELGVKRVIAFSTTSIMGKADSRNPYEQELIQKMQQAEKALLEVCSQHNIACTILRPTMIYGCGLDRNVSSIVRFLQRFGFFPVANPGKGMREPVHADDLAKAVMACMGNPATSGKIYNLGGGERLTYRAMVTRICTALGVGNRCLTVPGLPLALDIFSVLSRRPDTNGEIARRMNNDLVFDISPAREDFGYAPRSFLADGKDDLGVMA